MIPAYFNRQIIEGTHAEQYHWNRYNLNNVSYGTGTLSSSGAVLPSVDRSAQIVAKMQKSSINQKAESQAPAQKKVAKIALPVHDNSDIETGTESGQVNLAQEQPVENKVAVLEKPEKLLEDRSK